MLTLFNCAMQKVKEDFSDPDILNRLDNISVEVIASSHMAKNLRIDNYKKFSNIPAYYDPNSKTIYLNGNTLPAMDDLTIFIICYHELMHGISLHNNYQNEDFNVFQSGVKIERFGNNSYFCANRLLNEGIVQFLTTNKNEVDENEYAYAHEVGLVRKMSESVGTNVVINALLYGSYAELQAAFDDIYGAKSFIRFTKLLDKRDYEAAEAILDQPKTAEPIFIHYPLRSHQTVALHQQ